MAWLAHYGVPKSQWSDEARRRYDAQHRGGKTMPWDVAIRNLKRGYDEYQEQNHNRGGNRSNNIHNKVDESRVNARRSRDNGDSARFDRAQSSRRHTNGTGVRKPSSNSRTPLRDTSIRSKNPGREEVRRSDLNETQRPLRNGKNASRRSKNTTSTQAADAAISRNMRSGKNSYNPTDDYRNQSQAARGRQQIERASNIITGNTSDRGALRNYYHNGNFIKRNEQTDAYLRELGIDPNSNRLVATPKRPENRVNSGTVTNARNRDTVNHRTDNPIARAAKEAKEAEILRKNAENRKNRSTRRTSKTWNNKSSQSRKTATASSRQYRQYGWENPSSFRDAVEYDRRVAQINRGSNGGYPTEDLYRPTTATDQASTRRRRQRRRR